MNQETKFHIGDVIINAFLSDSDFKVGIVRAVDKFPLICIIAADEFPSTYHIQWFEPLLAGRLTYVVSAIDARYVLATREEHAWYTL